MLTSWLLMAAAVLGQVPTTRPAEGTAGPADRPAREVAPAPQRPAGRAPQYRVVIPGTQPAPAEEEETPPVQVIMPGVTTTMPEGALEGLSGGPVGIQVTETGVVITAQNPEDIEYLRELIEMMDRQPDMEFQFFPLEHATAREAAQSLQDLWTKAKTGPTGRIVPEDRISVVAEPRANIVIVAATPENMPEITRIVKAIDQPVIGPKAIQFKQIPLQHIQAAEAQRVIQEWMAELQRQRGLSSALYNIRADVRTNSLLVAAPQADIEQIEHILQLIDVPPTLEGGGVAKVAIFPLTKAVATELADSLREMLRADTPAAEAVEEQIRRLQVTLRQADGERELPELNLEKPITITAEEGTNSVVVQSTEQNLEAIGEIIRVLDTVPLADEMMVKLFPLKHADAETLRSNLISLFSEGQNLPEQPGRNVPGRIPPGLPGAALAYNVAISADPRTNTLIVAGRPEQVYLATQIITGIDVPEQPGRFPPRLIQLKHAGVERVQSAIDEYAQLRQQLNERLSPLEQARERILVIPNARTNSLVVIANDENFQEIQAIASKLDTAGEHTRFVKLQIADAVNVADRLRSMFEGIRQAVGDQADQFQLEIIPDTRTNTIILAGTQTAMTRAEEIIPALDQPAVTATYETKVYRLQQAAAVRLAPVLEQLFEQRTTAEQAGQRTPIFVFAEPATNSLIVSASRIDQTDVSRLLDQLDKPSDLAQQMQVISLTKARAAQVAETLRDLVEAQQAEGVQGGFSVVADERTNSLVVFAPPDLMTTVQDVVRRLDRAQPGAVLAMRVFRLENAIAEQLADTLNQFFEAAGAGTGENVRQLVIRFFPVSRETGAPIIDPATGERVVQTLVHQDITIAADPYTNSLLVMAPADHIDMMEMLVRMLDSIEPRTAKIEAYQLRNADAEELADLLESLFEPTTGGRGDEEGRRLVIAGPGAPMAGGEGAGGEIPISFAVDRRTNTLIAAGTPAQLKIVESLVYRLDDEPVDERVVRVVPLQYAEADTVAETLSSFFESESGLLEEAEEGAAATRLLQRRVTIESGGETSNMLLLSYSPRLESQIVTLINELDRPPPQVMVQVLMAEVTLDDQFEMGMEFALQDLLFSEKAFLGGNGVIRGPGHDFIGGTDLGAAGSGLGGVSFTVTSEDFNFLVRALQVEGRLQVLSRPSLLVQDNEEASIKIGEQVPVVDQITQTGLTVIPSVTYRDVGVNLDVRPIINPDGFVNMMIAPEISALGVSSVSIGSGVTLPVITQRKAETSVTVKDGETIIIGGLITSRSSETENKVPVLGDIPLLGLAFRATVKTETKTELLMVLTPKVVRNPEEARTMSVQMRDQTGLMDEARKNPLMQGLQVKPEDDQLGPIDVMPVPVPVTPVMPPPPVGDEYGPQLDEFGPPTTSIDFGGGRDRVAVRD